MCDMVFKQLKQLNRQVRCKRWKQLNCHLKNKWWNFKCQLNQKLKAPENLVHLIVEFKAVKKPNVKIYLEPCQLEWLRGKVVELTIGIKAESRSVDV